MAAWEPEAEWKREVAADMRGISFDDEDDVKLDSGGQRNWVYTGEEKGDG